MGRKILDITGQKFGRLTAIQYAGRDKWNKPKWICSCECGKTTVCLANNLRRGNTKSCGCLNVENTKERSTKHGKRQTRLYNIWSLMKNRCKDKSVKNYGGRGITVCDEWKNNFIAFYQWAINNGYSDELTIDRIDNNKSYSPDNCRWANVKEQAQNRRTNHNVLINGETYLITEAAKMLGVDYRTIARRLKRGEKIEI